MKLSTEILQAMLLGANPLFLVGLIALHERQPLAVQQALKDASNAYYNELEKKHEHNQLFEMRKRNDNIYKPTRRSVARKGAYKP